MWMLSTERKIKVVSMIKYIILEPNNQFIIIVHAAPNKKGVFQWYLTDALDNASKTNITNKVYESIVLSSDEIKEKYQNKWLACHCHIDGEDSSYNQGSVYLTSDFIDMIRYNQFDQIEIYDEAGNFQNWHYGLIIRKD